MLTMFNGGWASVSSTKSNKFFTKYSIHGFTFMSDTVISITMHNLCTNYNGVVSFVYALIVSYQQNIETNNNEMNFAIL